MADIVVAAESRTETGKNANRRLRERGLVPAVLYSGQKKTVSLAVPTHALKPILHGMADSTLLFDLDISGSRRKVIIKETQIEPIHGSLLHVDFYEVALDKPIHVSVHVELTGVPVGVKTQGGVLDFITRSLEVECLPTAIPERIVVDVSPLEIGKHMRVSALTPPPGVKFITDPEVVVAHVVVQREEEAAPAVEAAPVAEVTEPEVIKKGKPAEETAEPEEKEKK